MKNTKKAICILFLLICSMSLNACSSKTDEIQNTLDEFEYACQNLDIDAILNCIDPDVAQPIQAAIVVYSLTTGQDPEDSLDTIVETVFGKDFDSSEYLDTLCITDSTIKQKGHTAVVNCTIEFEISGQMFKKNTIINMMKQDDKWYISSIQLSSDSE